MASTNSTLVARNLTRTVETVEGSRDIIEDFSFSFEPERIYAIVGPSGAGKSSLLRMFNRLDDPTSGEIVYGGTSTVDSDPCTLRQNIGYLFQTPYMFPGTVADNIRFADESLGDADIRALIETVHLTPNLVDAIVDNLSVGEQQRVALARMLAVGPDVILLDEPTSALDPTHTSLIEQLIVELVNSRKLTAIVVTHHPEQAVRLGGEALLLVNGKLIESGSAEEVINRPTTELGRQYQQRQLK